MCKLSFSFGGILGSADGTGELEELRNVSLTVNAVCIPLGTSKESSITMGESMLMYEARWNFLAECWFGLGKRRGGREAPVRLFNYPRLLLPSYGNYLIKDILKNTLIFILRYI